MSTAPHVTPVARRYGRALFEAALGAGCLDQVQADMHLFGTVFADADAAAAMLDPRVEQARKGELLRKTFGEFLHPVTVSLLAVLERRKRLDLMVQLPAAFAALLDEHQGRLRGLLESAQPVDDETRTRLEKALSASTGKEVHLDTKVIEDLLGGVRITLAGTRFDGSARGRLDRLRQRLATVELS